MARSREEPQRFLLAKASLANHLAERAGVEPNAAKEFTLPGLLKVVAQDMPAKKKRFGKDPFTGEEKWFAAKPASVRLKVRPLKKLKDAAL